MFKEHIEYKLISLTCKVLTTSQPHYLHSLISIHCTCTTRYFVTLNRPSDSVSLRITNHSLRYVLSYLWNPLPPSFGQSNPVLSSWFTSSSSPCFRYHRLSLSQPFTPDLNPNCSINPFLRRLSGSPILDSYRTYSTVTFVCSSFFLYTPCPKKTCDYIFYNNFNNRCPVTIIFGIVSSKSMRHRKMVSFPTSPI